MATISVIVPVYKVEPYLRRCVDSILAQTYTDFELILVDDGSPDNCGKICDEYAAKDNRIKVIHQANAGVSAARNAGIGCSLEDARIKYLTFVDPDDWITVNCLQELANGIAGSEGIACARHSHIALHGDYGFKTIDTGWTTLPTEDYWVAPNNLPVSPCSKLFDKRLFSNIRFPVGKAFEDEAIMHRVLFQVKSIAYRGIRLYNYYHRNNGATGSAWSTKYLDSLEALKDECAFFDEHNYYRAHEWARGRLYCQMINCSIHLANLNLDKEKAKEFREYVIRDNNKSRVPFWENRDLYRNLEPRFFKLRWFCAMLINTFKHGKSSWLVQDGLGTIRQALYPPTE